MLPVLRAVTNHAEGLEEAVEHFASLVCEKLRARDQFADQFMVFIRTNPFRSEVPQYSRSVTTMLIISSQDSRVLIDRALALLRSLYLQGYQYAKAGVLVSELVTKSARQADLFEAESVETEGSTRSERLMALIDRVNRQSRGGLTTARQAGSKAYAMRLSHLSPAYATDWRHLPVVR